MILIEAWKFNGVLCIVAVAVDAHYQPWCVCNAQCNTTYDHESGVYCNRSRLLLVMRDGFVVRSHVFEMVFLRLF